MTTGSKTLVSVVTPAFNEELNIVALHKRVSAIMQEQGCDWDWVIVDDHSSDKTFEVVDKLSSVDPHIKGVRLSRNSGSHIALICGLNLCQGNVAICLAADLQDPPEVIVDLMRLWESGKQVVWGAREERLGESFWTKKTSLCYYWMMRNIVGMQNMPPTGADVFLIDRIVINAVKRFQESNISIFALITWLGFRQGRVTYTKRARSSGASGWTFRKKIKLLIDSIVGFSYFPIRLISYFGAITALSGFLVAALLIIQVLTTGNPPEGWTSVVVSVLTIGGIQILMLGVLGEYIWRGLDEARSRPNYLIEQATGDIALPGDSKISNDGGNIPN